jgi:hypothetical protein
MKHEKANDEKEIHKLFETGDINVFLRTYNKTVKQLPAFCDYLKTLCRENKIQPGRIIDRANISRTFGHQLFSGARNPTRDRVIQLAFGFGMNFEQTQKLLTIARKSTLNPRVRRDAIVIFGFMHGRNILDVQSMLFDSGMAILGEER